MPEPNSFSQEVTNQITPANLGKAWWLTVVLAIVGTGIAVNMSISQRQMQINLSVLTSLVHTLTEDHIRLEGVVERNQAVNEVIHAGTGQ